MALSWLIAAMVFLAVERWARGSRFFLGLAMVALAGMLLALCGASWPWQLGLFLLVGPPFAGYLGSPRTVSLILPPGRRV
ncbi:MAG: hypothetical protein P9M14_14555 [Candidatus Alcyoniella australis]|nr:hypothetical protein [Candidatus Alcyoniella australis]